MRRAVVGGVYFSVLLAAIPVAFAQTITTYAGGVSLLGDGQRAEHAALNYPQQDAIAIDKDGNLYIADTGDCLIRKVSTAGIISTIAGVGCAGPYSDTFAGDGGPAVAATLGLPTGIVVDTLGNIYFSDTRNGRVRRITPGGIIDTIAGHANDGMDGADGGPATKAQLFSPGGLALDAVGNLYIADTAVRKVAPDGTISTIGGTGAASYCPDPPVAANSGIAVDGIGNIYATSSCSRVYKISPSGVVTTFAGSNDVGGYSGDGGPAISARLDSPQGVAIDRNGNVFIADTSNSVVRKVALDGSITTVAGTGQQGYSGDSGPATLARLFYPSGVATDGLGNLYINDTGNGSGNNVIRKVTSDGKISTVAGNGTTYFLGDAGPAVRAALSYPLGVTVDAIGNVYVADSNHNRVRKITPGGTISTAVEEYQAVAVTADAIGNVYLLGFRGCVGQIRPDGSTRALAGPCDLSVGSGGETVQLDGPYGIAVDHGNIFIADSSDNVIRKLSPDGTFTTVVGNGYGAGTPGGGAFGGDGGPALEAELNIPTGVALDASGNIYIADTFNQRVRKVSADGIISTIAGNGEPGFAGDGGPATVAKLNYPFAVATDAEGNVYIADAFNNRIRKVTPAGIILSIAGNGVPAYFGDAGPPTSAALFDPSGVALDRAGNMYIADSGNNAIRKVSSVSSAGMLNLNQRGLSGSWFNPATGGQGFEMAVYPDANGPGQGVLFAGWFTYDSTAAGGRRWYGLQGNVDSSGVGAELQIFAVEGGNFNSPPAVGPNGALGHATLQLGDCNTGSLTYSFNDGRSDAIPLIRLTPNVTCGPSGDNGAPASDSLLSGNWFNPETSGQGLMFDFSPSLNLVFAAWYTFKPNGQQIGGPASQDWYTLQSDQFVPGMTSLDGIPIVETSGGVFNDSTPAGSIQAGTARISFQSCDAMTLNYQFTAGENIGKVGSMNLIRIGPTPTGCALQ